MNGVPFDGPLPVPAVRTVIPLSDSDSDWDPDVLLEASEGLRRRIESVERRSQRRDIPPFQASPLPLPLVQLDAPPVVSHKRTAVQDAGSKSARVSRKCFAGR